MELKKRNALELYRASPQVTPSAQVDAFVLAAARASPEPVRRGRELFVAGAVAVAVAAAFFVRISTTPTQDFASADFGLEEGRTRAWLMNLDLQQPTGPGSQEGLP